MDITGNAPFGQIPAEPNGAHRGARLPGTTSRTTQVSQAAAMNPDVAAVTALAMQRLGLQLPAIIPPAPHVSRTESSHPNDQRQPQALEQEEQSAASEDNVAFNTHPNPQCRSELNPPPAVHATLTQKQIEEAADLLIRQILQSQPPQQQTSARQAVRQTSMMTDHHQTQNLEKIVDDRINAAMSYRSDRPMTQYSSPFIVDILDSLPAPGTKIPTPEKYNGKTDPLDYLQHFQSTMSLHCVPDAIQCKAFCTAFQEGARRWFNSLPPGCITCFEDFRRLFLNHFATSKRPQKTALEVMQLTQGRDESLREFITRFNNEAVEVPDLTCSSMLAALMSNTRNEEFKKSLALDQPQSIQEIRSRADKYIQLEEVLRNTRRRMDDRSPNDRTGNSHKRQKGQSGWRKPTDRRGYQQEFTPLNARYAEVLAAMQADGEPIREPEKMKTPYKERNRSVYCRFHREVGHDTEDCWQLKKEIELLIQKGRLGRFIRHDQNAERDNQRRTGRPDNRRPPWRRNDRNDRGRQNANADNRREERRRSRDRNDRRTEQQDDRPTGVINTIFGGSAAGGSTAKGRKRYVKQVDRDSSTKRPRESDGIISFDESDLNGVSCPHDDALVVDLNMDGYEVKRVMIDTGSSVDLLYYEAFKQMKVPEDRLLPINGPIKGVTGASAYPFARVYLKVKFGQKPCRIEKDVEFLVVKFQGAYNAIIGRTTQNALRSVVSTYYQVMKFPTPHGVGTVRGQQRIARECYLAETKTLDGAVVLTSSFDVRADEEMDRMNPVEETQRVVLDEADPSKFTNLGSALQKNLAKEITDCLVKNKTVFAWVPSDMPGISRSVACHSLGIRHDCKPIRQKKRWHSKERQGVIEKEVQKLLEAGFIREVKYPEWLANVVLVKKKNGKWRMCIDFTDLNKACPKDSFPLPKIDQLVDSTSGHELLSFLDAFSGYHQIQMSPEDEEKTAFITDQGTYCYQVMPFGLKNAGATYQRLVMEVFKKQIGRSVEAYVDDMVVKSKTAAEHVGDLKEVFQTLDRFQMKLNPEKCVFGVASGKFLGFMITQRGIEANPEKIEAIIQMPSPQCLKDVQILTGQIVSLSRFISRLGDKCLPFFKVLRKANVTQFQWPDECEQAFQHLKQYLSSPPVLQSPVDGENLVLYLAVTEGSISAVLIRSEGNEQHPIYYVSKVLTGPETRYTPIEKLALSLITAARKLRPYFQSHTIEVWTDQPLRQCLQKPETSGRLIKWAVELGEFDIQYKPRTTIKAQTLADFIAEMSRPILEDEQFPSWSLFVDGSSNAEGCGAGVVLISPHMEDKVEYALRLEFKASNNEAEYEALIAGLQLAKEMEVKHLKIYSDSQVVVGQVTGQYEAKGNNMIKYLELVKQELSNFKQYSINRIERAQNAKADALSKMASDRDAVNSSLVERLNRPSIQKAEEVHNVDTDRPSWTEPIMRYLLEGRQPEDASAAKKLRIKAAEYTVVNGALYKRSYDWPLLRCLTEEEVEQAMAEVHEGMCGNHVGGRMLAHRLIRQGYYWPTMRRDCQEKVDRCEACQRNSNVSHQPTERMKIVSHPIPFAQWGIDILGPFPLGPGQKKFLIVAVEYFTKWVEAESVATITEGKVESFVKKNILCRFGMPMVLVTDNGRQFDNDKFKDFCDRLKIKLHLTSVAHPQSNGLAENTNKKIMNALKKRLDGRKTWVEEVDEVLWAYRTTPNGATGETPFRMTFGAEALVPVEAALHNQRVSSYDEERNDVARRAELVLLSEDRERAAARSEAIRQKATKFYNRRVKTSNVRVGGYALRKAEAAGKHPGKLGQAWEGPYRVIKQVGHGSYILSDEKGKILPRPWNSQNLKAFYQ